MRARTIITYLLQGALISILVAWLCILGPGADITIDGEGIRENPAALLRIGDYDSLDVIARGYGWDRNSRDVREASSDGSTRYRVVISWCAGWPFRALWAEHRGEHSGPTVADAALGVPVRPWTGLPLRWLGVVWFQTEWCSRRLPLVPLPGLVLDAAFWGALAWLVIRGPWHIRAAIRRRKRRCPACAYPIGSSPVCTECGGRLR